MFARQIIFSVASKLVYVGSVFLQGILIARLLHADGRGTLTLILLVPSLFVSLGDMGLKQSASNFVGKKMATVDDVIATLLYVWVFTSGLSIAVVMVCYQLQGVLHFGWALLGLALLTMPVNLFSAYGQGVALGVRNVTLINFNQLIQGVGGVLLIALFVGVLKLELLGALLAFFIVSLCQAANMFLFLRKTGRVRIHRVPGLPSKMVKNGLHYAIALFILSLNYRVDVLILKQFVGLKEIGLYAVGVTLSETLWHFPSAIGLVIFSHSSASSDAKQFALKTAKLLRILMPIVFFAGLVVAAVAPWLIPLFYGKEFEPSVWVVWAILPGILSGFIFKILNSDLAGRGRPTAALWVYLFALSLNVAVNFLLIPRFGIIGAAVASSVSYTIGAAIFLTVYVRLSGITLRDVVAFRMEDYRGILSRFRGEPIDRTVKEEL